jgi:hypothetical protein
VGRRKLTRGRVERTCTGKRLGSSELVRVATDNARPFVAVAAPHTREGSSRPLVLRIAASSRCV